MAKNTQQDHTYDCVVQIALPGDFAENLETYCVNQETLVEWLDEVCAEGYSVKTEYDADRTNYSTRLFGPRTKAVNRGQVLFANGPTAFMSLNVLRFKHLSPGAGSSWETVATDISGSYS